jgi:FkbM family methyltransferase
MVNKHQHESLEGFYSVIRQKFKNDDDVRVILDIGSRHCLESVEFSKKFKNAKIYAFEANPTSYQECVKNSINFNNIKVVNICINEYDGFCKFYPINPSKTQTSWFDGNLGASSLFLSNGAVDHIEKYVQDEIEMPCIRLDTFCNIEKIEKIDAIWMDLQGGELLALKGLGDLLDSVEVIQTELEINPMYHGQCLYKETNEFLEKKGFKKVSGNDNAVFGADFIYIKQ